MSNTKTQQVENTAEAWESGALGLDDEYVVVNDDAGLQERVDDSLGLQMISVRLQKGLLEDLRMIAEINGVGYQSLMKQVLARFVESEKKRILVSAASKARSNKFANDEDCPDEPERRRA